MKKCKTFAEVLELLFKESGLSYRRFSLMAGLSVSAVHRAVNAAQTPRSDILQRLLCAAGKSWAWLDSVLAWPELPVIEMRRAGRPKKAAPQ